MTHTVTGKLNKAAHAIPGEHGTTFMINLGEKNYNYKDKKSDWTNYSAAVFAKGNQVQFYQSALQEGAVVSVSGTGILVEVDPQYGPKLMIQNAQLVFAHNPAGQQQQQAPQQYQQPQQQAPQQAGFQQAPQQYQQPQQQAPQQFFTGTAEGDQIAMQRGEMPRQQAPQMPQAPAGFDSFDDDIPF